MNNNYYSKAGFEGCGLEIFLLWLLIRKMVSYLFTKAQNSHLTYYFHCKVF